MPESREDRAERLIDELREVTSEAARVLKDLSRTMREAREQVEGYLRDQVEQDLNRFTQLWQKDAQAFVDQARSDTERHSGIAVERAKTVMDTAASYEVLCEELASRMARIYKRTTGGAELDFGLGMPPFPNLTQTQIPE